MKILEHFAVSHSDGDQVLAVWSPGETIEGTNISQTTWGVYWSDAPSLSPVGYAFHEFENLEEALNYFRECGEDEMRERGVK